MLQIINFKKTETLGCTIKYDPRQKWNDVWVLIFFLFFEAETSKTGHTVSIIKLEIINTIDGSALMHATVAPLSG